VSPMCPRPFRDSGLPCPFLTLETMVERSLFRAKRINHCNDFVARVALARMSHRGGGERRKGARSGDGGRSRSRNHRNGPSSTVLLAVLAPRVAIFCQGKTHHSPDLLCCPMALGTCSLQQRRAATCNCRCT
jgi:hypothetical protein